MDLMDVDNPTPSLTNASYDQKWEILKPTIERLYVREKWKLKDIISEMKKQYGFFAVESQYKYQITKKWQLKKSMSTAKKAAVCAIVINRAQLGKSSTITRDGQSLESKNLRRYMKTEARKEMTLHPTVIEQPEISNLLSSRVAQFGNRIFMNWNMPHGLTKGPRAGPLDNASPLSDVVVTTPSSPHDTPSPLAVAIRDMTAINRARLLTEGRHADLLGSMDKQQRQSMSTWLYHFWLFSFKTAKHWGRGPRAWTADMLDLDQFQPGKPTLVSSPTAPVTISGTPPSRYTLTEAETLEGPPRALAACPTSLCRWSIHYHQVFYESIPEQPAPTAIQFDLDNEETWPAWPAFDTQVLTETLSNGLEHNEFTTVKSDDLPVAMNQAVRAARGSSKELLAEALGFSIMSRNIDTIVDQLEELKYHYYDLSGFYPFHLAVAYLDGSKTCCNVLEQLMDSLPVRRLYVNDLGHTVLDQFMLAILGAHTSCTPSIVDDFFKKDKRYEGEDVDICGRWDADSPCIRELVAKGNTGIPLNWKHMFCHTSVQTICHGLETLFGPNTFDINIPSGLFIRRCLYCGLKLQVLPIQALMVVGLYLSHSGFEGETLFGILACLLCLLSLGADPRLKANVSLDSLLGNDESYSCAHKEMDAIEFVKALIDSCGPTWSKEVQTAWKIISYVLNQSLDEWALPRIPSGSQSTESGSNDVLRSFVVSDDDQTETGTETEANRETYLPTRCGCQDNPTLNNIYGPSNFFGGRTSLATLWAAIKSELLTYRRLEEGDPWLSQNFDLNTLCEGLQSGHKVSIRLVEGKMMKPFCECGRFSEKTVGCAVADEACSYYFSNMDNWNRTTFIDCPNHEREFTCCGYS